MWDKLTGRCYTAEATYEQMNRQTDGKHRCVKPLLSGEGLTTVQHVL